MMRYEFRIDSEKGRKTFSIDFFVNSLITFEFKDKRGEDDKENREKKTKKCNKKNRLLQLKQHFFPVWSLMILRSRCLNNKLAEDTGQPFRLFDVQKIFMLCKKCLIEIDSYKLTTWWYHNWIFMFTMNADKKREKMRNCKI